MQTVDYRHFPLATGDKLLDIGCGQGRHAIGAWARAHDDILAVGVDLCSEDLRVARSSLQGFSSRRDAECFFVEGSGLCLPFGDAVFEKVICSEVLEHLHDYDAALAEARRVIKPDGLLCVSVPRFWTEAICWLLSRGYRNEPGGHIRIFRARQLRRAVTRAGFRYQRRHWAHALHSPYWWLKCLFWRRRDDHLLIRLYHRLLVWDLLSSPRFLRWIERALNPFLGKSIVMYFQPTSRSARPETVNRDE